MTKKISYGILILVGLFIGWIVFGFMVGEYKESKFYDIEIPKNVNFEKPIEYLSNGQIDSLEKMEVSNEKILIIGDGYSGYDFYMWHKPTEKGEVYIKAFELTQNVQLSEWKLSTRTKNRITKLSGEYELYKGNTVIDEGTFKNFYPARFELWFKSESSGNEEKLAQKNYVIDGWDR